MMIKEKFIEYYVGHRGAINGALVGFLLAVFIIVVGFFKALFIALCTGVGYYIGKRISEDRDYIKNLLDRVLPPGTYR